MGWTVMQDGLTEEGLRSFYVPMLAEVEVDRLTSLIDRAVEVHPFAFDLDRGLIHPPGTPDRLGILSPALFKDRYESHDPTHDGRMRHRQPALGHHFDEIPVAELEANVPANAEDDHQAVEMAAFEQMVGECHAHDCRPSRVLAPEPAAKLLRNDLKRGSSPTTRSAIEWYSSSSGCFCASDTVDISLNT